MVLSIGENEQMSGEARSRSDIEIPRAEHELADAGKPVVVLLRNSGPGEAVGAQLSISSAPGIKIADASTAPGPSAETWGATRCRPAATSSR